MAAQVDSSNLVPHVAQLGGDTVPEAGIRCETVDQQHARQSVLDTTQRSCRSPPVDRQPGPVGAIHHHSRVWPARDCVWPVRDFLDRGTQTAGHETHPNLDQVYPGPRTCRSQLPARAHGHRIGA